MNCFTDIRELDAGRIRLCIDCCIQAYNAFVSNNPAVCAKSRVQPPGGYELIDSWTGIDAVFGRDRTVETFGLVFRSVAPPWRYIFAFRGTDSILDMLDDLGVEHQAFISFDSDIEVPEGVRIEAGFDSIYRGSDGVVASMQHQLFALVDKYQTSTKPISEILITGHSLGAALSQLFMLDLALSRSGIQAFNINFASPRVGNHAYIGLVENNCPNPILRVQNTHDAVPHLPPTKLGFEHVPTVYMIAFYSTDTLGKLDVMASHSSINYRAVIVAAGESEQGVCVTECLLVPQGKAPICSDWPDVGNRGQLAIRRA